MGAGGIRVHAYLPEIQDKNMLNKIHIMENTSSGKNDNNLFSILFLICHRFILHCIFPIILSLPIADLCDSSTNYQSYGIFVLLIVLS